MDRALCKFPSCSRPRWRTHTMCAGHARMTQDMWLQNVMQRGSAPRLQIPEPSSMSAQHQAYFASVQSHGEVFLSSHTHSIVTRQEQYASVGAVSALPQHPTPVGEINVLSQQQFHLAGHNIAAVPRHQFVPPNVTLIPQRRPRPRALQPFRNVSTNSQPAATHVGTFNAIHIPRYPVSAASQARPSVRPAVTAVGEVNALPPESSVGDVSVFRVLPQHQSLPSTTKQSICLRLLQNGVPSTVTSERRGSEGLMRTWHSPNPSVETAVSTSSATEAVPISAGEQGQAGCQNNSDLQHPTAAQVDRKSLNSLSSGSCFENSATANEDTDFEDVIFMGEEKQGALNEKESNVPALPVVTCQSLPQIVDVCSSSTADNTQSHAPQEQSQITADPDQEADDILIDSDDDCIILDFTEHDSETPNSPNSQTNEVSENETPLEMKCTSEPPADKNGSEEINCKGEGSDNESHTSGTCELKIVEIVSLADKQYSENYLSETDGFDDNDDADGQMEQVCSCSHRKRLSGEEGDNTNHEAVSHECQNKESDIVNSIDVNASAALQISSPVGCYLQVGDQNEPVGNGSVEAMQNNSASQVVAQNPEMLKLLNQSHNGQSENVLDPSADSEQMLPTDKAANCVFSEPLQHTSSLNQFQTENIKVMQVSDRLLYKNQNELVVKFESDVDKSVPAESMQIISSNQCDMQNQDQSDLPETVYVNTVQATSSHQSNMQNHGPNELLENISDSDKNISVHTVQKSSTDQCGGRNQDQNELLENVSHIDKNIFAESVQTSSTDTCHMLMHNPVKNISDFDQNVPSATVKIIFSGEYDAMNQDQNELPQNVSDVDKNVSTESVLTNSTDEYPLLIQNQNNSVQGIDQTISTESVQISSTDKIDVPNQDRNEQFENVSDISSNESSWSAQTTSTEVYPVHLQDQKEKVSAVPVEPVIARPSDQSSPLSFYSCGGLAGSCGFRALMPSQLECHLEEAHPHELYPCIHCGCIEGRRDTLMCHMEQHLALHSLYCSHLSCDYSSFSPEEVLSHMQVSHPALINDYICWRCNSNFTTWQAFNSHVQANMLTVVKCPHCLAKDVNRETVLRHIISSHPGFGRMVSIHKVLLCHERKLNGWKQSDVEHDISVSTLYHIPKTEPDTSDAEPQQSLVTENVNFSGSVQIRGNCDDQCSQHPTNIAQNSEEPRDSPDPGEQVDSKVPLLGIRIALESLAQISQERQGHVTMNVQQGDCAEVGITTSTGGHEERFSVENHASQDVINDSAEHSLSHEGAVEIAEHFVSQEGVDFENTKHVSEEVEVENNENISHEGEDFEITEHVVSQEDDVENTEHFESEEGIDFESTEDLLSQEPGEDVAKSLVSVKGSGDASSFQSVESDTLDVQGGENRSYDDLIEPLEVDVNSDEKDLEENSDTEAKWIEETYTQQDTEEALEILCRFCNHGSVNVEDHSKHVSARHSEYFKGFFCKGCNFISIHPSAGETHVCTFGHRLRSRAKGSREGAVSRNTRSCSSAKRSLSPANTKSPKKLKANSVSPSAKASDIPTETQSSEKVSSHSISPSSSKKRKASSESNIERTVSSSKRGKTSDVHMKYMCKLCDHTEFTRSMVCKHVYTKHPSVMVCPICDEQQSTDQMFFRHFEVEHPDQRVIYHEVKVNNFYAVNISSEESEGSTTCRDVETASAKDKVQGASHESSTKHRDPSVDVPRESAESTKSRTVYQCKLCNFSYPKKGDVQLHIYKRHKERMKCPVCDKSVTSDKQFNNHLRRSHQQKRLYPKYNSMKWISVKRHGLVSDDSGRHTENMDNPETLICSSAETRGENKSKMTYQCKLCNFSYQNLSEVRMHIYEFHKERMKCPVCDKSVTSDKHFHSHLSRNHQKKRFYLYPKYNSMKWISVKRPGLVSDDSGRRTENMDNPETLICSSADTCGENSLEIPSKDSRVALKPPHGKKNFSMPPSNFQPDLIICRLCAFCDQSLPLMCKHLFQVHDEVQCSACSVKVCSQAWLTRHLKQMHPEEEQDILAKIKPLNWLYAPNILKDYYHCKLCLFRAKSISSTYRHLYRVHPEFSSKCSACDSSFKHFREMMQHIRDEHSDQVDYLHQKHHPGHLYFCAAAGKTQTQQQKGKKTFVKWSRKTETDVLGKKMSPPAKSKAPSSASASVSLDAVFDPSDDTGTVPTTASTMQFESHSAEPNALAVDVAKGIDFGMMPTEAKLLPSSELADGDKRDPNLTEITSPSVKPVSHSSVKVETPMASVLSLDNVSVDIEMMENKFDTQSDEAGIDVANNKISELKPEISLTISSETGQEMEYRCPHCIAKCKERQKFYEHLCYHYHYRCYMCGHCTFKAFSQSAVQNHCIKTHDKAPQVVHLLKQNMEDRIERVTKEAFVSTSAAITERRRLGYERAKQKKLLNQENKKHKVKKTKTVTVKSGKLKTLAVKTGLSKKSENGERKWLRCPYCRGSKKTKRAVESEIMGHIKYKLYRCSYCDFLSTSQLLAERHMAKEHSGQAVKVRLERDEKKEQLFKRLLDRAIQMSRSEGGSTVTEHLKKKYEKKPKEPLKKRCVKKAKEEAWYSCTQCDKFYFQQGQRSTLQCQQRIYKHVQKVHGGNYS